ncbi:DUF4878 domain-containing protein [Desulfofundulus thermocisternus]|uniref:DUF4878 domain-containing protein n=1 Tax=Desulfofundulus thermocisternus TaxID=42471 RepID=UPI00217DA519|nr:DUF4878 domain-containing protein [Desulfofundulus thermocisternus]MCS5697266.1 DUF4878 domain-containing protein [Desulfofundulus thermocisternus]
MKPDRKATLLLVATLLVAAFLTGCGKGNTVDSPGKSLIAFFKAMSDNNFTEAAKYIDMICQSNINLMYGSVANYLAQNNSPDSKYIASRIRIISQDIKGNEADVKFKLEGENKIVMIHMVKQDGVWRLPLDKYSGDLLIEPVR